MAGIKIISDSTCDLSPELLAKYDIELVPLTISLGEDFYQDGINMKVENIYDYVDRTGNLPKTSAVNVFDYAEHFSKWVEQGCDVVHINIGSEFSSSYQNACLAATEFDGHVEVVDSANLSTGQGLLVIRAAELAAEGMSAADIHKALDEMAPKVDASFVINCLDYLYKGGRCSGVAALGANLLQLKVCINVTDGKMFPGKKYRAQYVQAVKKYVADRLGDQSELDMTRVFVTHTRCDDPDLPAMVIDEIRRLRPDFGEILETVAGSTITTHCGPNTLGVLFVRK